MVMVFPGKVILLSEVLQTELRPAARVWFVGERQVANERAKAPYPPTNNVRGGGNDRVEWANREHGNSDMLVCSAF